MKLSEVVRHYRRKHGLTQVEMARHCRCSVSTIAKLEKPSYQKRPSVLTLWKLSYHMKLSRKELAKILMDYKGLTPC